LGKRESENRTWESHRRWVELNQTIPDWKNKKSLRQPFG